MVWGGLPSASSMQPCAWLAELTLSWPVGSCGPHSHSISLSGQQDAQGATWRQSGFGRREVHQVKLDDWLGSGLAPVQGDREAGQ